MEKSNIQQEAIDLAVRIGKLETQAGDYAALAKHRMMVTRVVGIIILAVMILYLTYAYQKISAVNAEEVAHAAKTYLEDSLPDMRRNLEDLLEREAENNVKLIEGELRKLPQMGAEFVRERLQERATAEVRKFEPEIESLLRASIIETQNAVGERELSEEDAKQMISDMVDDFRKDAKARIDKVYEEYSLPATGIAEYLKKLATTPNKDLSERERIQRDALTTFLAIISRYDLDFSFKVLGTKLAAPEPSSKES